MDITAVFITLIAVFPQVVPDRRQYFEYESIVISCEGLDGLTGWRVMRRIKGAVGPCVLKSSGPCEITSSFSMDSGEYWCEYQDIKRSNPINITVTAGSLILESPSHPVMEGDTVSLCCRNKTSNIKADFYKDGLLMRDSSTTNMIIHSVSKSDEGLYKCSIPGADESAESWLAVRGPSTSRRFFHTFASQQADAAFVHIVPSRLQFFEHEFVFIYCDGFFNDLTKWRVMKKMKETTTTCKSKPETPGPCNITTAFSFDSGEYWCEAEGKKSNVVDITVTDGFVILESPALPVTEGDKVILRCRNKTTSNLKAAFYKDGLLIKNTTTGEMIIHSITKSDEGLYRCNIFEAGKSAESWLAVRVLTVLVLLLSAQVQHSDCHKAAGSVILESPALPVMEGDDVTLRCRNRNKTTSNLKADFYKDGVLIRSSSTGNVTIRNVSQSDEGHYKCHISGTNESAESWLAVRDTSEAQLQQATDVDVTTQEPKNRREALDAYDKFRLLQHVRLKPHEKPTDRNREMGPSVHRVAASELAELAAK
ncbi:Low affinity immunoglobulin gamma Fc region receptor II Fc gamma receptor IIB [Larimichthys crocea]|nr:Low affinity immunoglobulin gamma Fc region receptor II Fc gamma receptor IIB [Larimichthys crocea]